MIEWLLDRLALKPTRNSIRCDSLQSSWIEVGEEKCELFERQIAPQSTRPMINIIKFLGAAGRAENVTEHPFDVWPENRGHAWVANPPGYGNSSGRASLRTSYSTAQAVYEKVREKAEGIPVLSGNSLGGAVAIGIASRNPVRGILVRDMPNIRRLIMERHGRFRRIASAFADRVPAELDVMQTAAKCSVPAVFVSSRKDRIVPPFIHDEIFEQYAGPKRMVHLEQADHMDLVSGKEEAASYTAALMWLYESIV